MVALAPIDQRRKSKRFEVSVGKPNREGLGPSQLPRATSTASRVMGESRTDPQRQQGGAATAWCFPLPPHRCPQSQSDSAGQVQKLIGHFAEAKIAAPTRMQRIPFDPFSMAVDHRQLLFMPIYFLLVALPFFCSGLAISSLLTRGSKAINRLYGYDLLGNRERAVGSVCWSVVRGVCFAWNSRRVLTTTAAFVSLALLAGEFQGRQGRPNLREREQEPAQHQLHLFSLEYIVACGRNDRDVMLRHKLLDALRVYRRGLRTQANGLAVSRQPVAHSELSCHHQGSLDSLPASAAEAISSYQGNSRLPNITGT